MKTIKAAVVLVLAGSTAVSAVEIGEVLERMRAAIEPRTDVRARIEMTVANPTGERAIWTGEVFRKGERKRLIFHSPADVQGLELVALADRDGLDRFQLYVPAVRRVRLIERDVRGEAFFGTDFNYEDIGFDELAFHEHEVIPAKTEEEQAYHVVKSIPEQGWWYGKIVRWIDRKTFLPMRAEYFAPTGELFKRRTIQKVESIDGTATPVEVLVETVPAGTSTRLHLSEVRYDTGLGDAQLAGQFGTVRGGAVGLGADEP